MGELKKKQACVNTSDFGPRPELKWIKLTELYIDQDYQRNAKSNHSMKNLAYMQEHFSWAHCGALIVCHVPEKKQYAVVDGQHRLIAARARGIEELPCVVVAGQDFRTQANSFVVVNTKRVKLSNLGAYHASVAAGDPDAVSLSEILAECDINIPAIQVPAGRTAPRQTQAVGTLLKMLADYSRTQIIWALTVIPEAYGDEEGCMRASILKAMAEYIKQHPDTDRDRMVAVLQEIEIDALEKDARAYKGIKGGTTTTAILEVLGRLYKNVGRRGAA